GLPLPGALPVCLTWPRWCRICPSSGPPFSALRAPLTVRSVADFAEAVRVRLLPRGEVSCAARPALSVAVRLHVKVAPGIGVALGAVGLACVRLGAVAELVPDVLG